MVPTLARHKFVFWQSRVTAADQPGIGTKLETPDKHLMLRSALFYALRRIDQAMIVSGAVLPIIVLANSGSFETKTQCMSILQRMLLGRAMPEEVRTRHAPLFLLLLLLL